MFESIGRHVMRLFRVNCMARFGAAVTVGSALSMWLSVDASQGQTVFQIQDDALLPQAPTGKAWAAWSDCNADSYADLVTNEAVWINRAGRGFDRMASPMDGAILGDYDNDGFPDAYSISHWNLYHNEGENGFVDASAHMPTLTRVPSQGASWADHDNDGDLDIYIGAYEATYPGPYQTDVILRNDGEAGFVIAWQQSGDIDPARGITSADYDNDGDIDIYVSNYRLEANLLWENDGMGKFTNVAKQRGVAGIDNGYSYSFGHTIGSAWGDMDNDGLIDLFVGNFSHPHVDQDRPRFYKNRGAEHDFSFADMSDNAGLAWQESFASPSLVDYDNDGDLDLYFTTVYNGDHSVLYRNDGDWHFTDVTAEAGLANMATTYQAAWADFDHDGDMDLFTAGQLYVNQTIEMIPEADRDTKKHDRHWLRVTLQGDGKRINRGAIGAQVRIELDEQTTLARQVEAGTGMGNQNELTLHFGLGARAEPVSLQIAWPGGTQHTLENVAVDQAIVVKWSDLNADEPTP